MGQFRYSIDALINDLGQIVDSGIGGVLLFGSTEEKNKNSHGHASFDEKWSDSTSYPKN